MSGSELYAVEIVITRWETESARSGLREWGAYACRLCHPEGFADVSRQERGRPTRLAAAHRDAALHADKIHGRPAIITERPIP